MSTTSTDSYTDNRSKTTAKPTITTTLRDHHKPTQVDARVTTIATVRFDCAKPLPHNVPPSVWANACNPVWATMQSLAPATSSSRTDAVAGSTTSASVPVANSDQSNSGFPVGTVAGAAVGGVVGVAVLIGVILYCRKKRKNGTNKCKAKKGHKDAAGSARRSRSGSEAGSRNSYGPDDEKGSGFGGPRRDTLGSDAGGGPDYDRRGSGDSAGFGGARGSRGSVGSYAGSNGGSDRGSVAASDVGSSPSI